MKVRSNLISLQCDVVESAEHPAIDAYQYHFKLVTNVPEKLQYDEIEELNSAYEANISQNMNFDAIPQTDGFDETDEIDGKKQAKMIFAINCEREEIITLINFLRSLNHLWLFSKEHSLCTLDASCYFCHLRSTFLRLRIEREKAHFHCN